MSSAQKICVVLMIFGLPLFTSCATNQVSQKPMFYKMSPASEIQPKDMDSVRSSVGNRSIVMLAESIHLTSEFSIVRRNIIQNLYDQNGFELLLFEGSPIEFWIAQDQYLTSDKTDVAVNEFQKTALFGLWQTKEINELLSAALKTQNSDKPMYISSYDVQIGQGRRFTQGKGVFDEFIKRLKAHKMKLSKSEENEVLFLNNLVSCKRKKFPASGSDVKRVESSLKTLDLVVSRTKSGSSLQMHELFLKRVPKFLNYTLEFCREANSSTRNYTEIRDEWASKQFLTQINDLGRKTIVWAHSGHIRLEPSKSGRMSFGAFVRRQLGKDIFALHFTARSGSAIAFMDADGNEIELIEKALRPIESVSLEKKLSLLDNQADLFIPVEGNEGFLGSSETTRSEPDGIGPINPIKDFDGYYLIKEIKPPKLKM